MRLAKEIYWVYLEKFGALNIGEILIPYEGSYRNIDDLPSAYIANIFGCTREELYEMILSEVDSTELEESLDDIDI